MKLIGEKLVENRAMLSPEQAAIKEKEGVFNMAEEEAQIAAMMQQLHGPVEAGPAQPKQIKADKKLTKRRR